MLVNFDEEMKELTGSTITRDVKKDVKGEDGKMVKEVVKENITLKSVCVDVLLNIPRDDKKEMTGEEKVKRYELAKIIFAGGEIDLESEPISLLKSLVGSSYLPLIVGPAFKMLEGKK